VLQVAFKNVTKEVINDMSKVNILLNCCLFLSTVQQHTANGVLYKFLSDTT